MLNALAGLNLSWISPTPKPTKPEADFSLKTKQLHIMLEGWTHPTLALLNGIWVIWSNKQTTFVPLEKASAALVAACPGAARQLEIEDSKPF